MEKIILKYEINTIDPNKVFSIEYPEHSKILKFNEQDGKFFLWVEVNSTISVSNYFVFRFTGMEYKENDLYNYVYVDTVQFGPLVYHLYKLTPVNK